MTELAKLLKKINTVSKKTKTPTYIVGGFVRDTLLGRPRTMDVDLVVDGRGIEFARRVDEALKNSGSLVEFADFDTARYIIGQGEEQVIIEFAGARSEQYESHSRKPIVASASLGQDLSRRDFTVNAMAVPIALYGGRVDPKVEDFHAQLVDPCGGLVDLKEQLLRTPLDPDTTFSDDPLRMLRAIRFAAELGFSIEANTLSAIHRNRERMKIISGERVEQELIKLMSTKMPSVGLVLMFQTSLMDVILPEISALDGVEDVYGHQHKNNLTHTFKVVDNIAERSPKPWLRLAGLFHDIGKPATKRFVPKIGWTFHAHEHVGRKMIYAISRRLKFSKNQTDYLAKLVRWHMQPIALMDEGITDSAVRRLIVTMGDLIDDLLLLGRSDITTGNPAKKERRLKNYDWLERRVAEVIEKDKLRAFQSPVRGEEIMAECRLKPGPTVGRIKKALEEAILDGIIPNEREAAMVYFKEVKDKYFIEAAPWEKIESPAA